MVIDIHSHIKNQKGNQVSEEEKLIQDMERNGIGFRSSIQRKRIAGKRPGQPWRFPVWSCWNLIQWNMAIILIPAMG